jgi:hypothetical protein
LFSIQPMFAKMVLPKLGGAPAVWSVAMVFFQTVLLGGYAYAHLLNRVLPPRWAAVFHLALVGVTATMLPIAIAPGWVAPAVGGNRALAVRPVCGLDRAAVLHAVGQRAAAANLVRGQRTPAGGQSLCALCRSNLGSFAALFAYPVIIEPFLTLKTQAAVWSIGFALLAILSAWPDCSRPARCPLPFRPKPATMSRSAPASGCGGSRYRPFRQASSSR